MQDNFLDVFLSKSNLIRNSKENENYKYDN